MVEVIKNPDGTFTTVTDLAGGGTRTQTQQADGSVVTQISAADGRVTTSITRVINGDCYTVTECADGPGADGDAYLVIGGAAGFGLLDRHADTAEQLIQAKVDKVATLGRAIRTSQREGAKGPAIREEKRKPEREARNLAWCNAAKQIWTRNPALSAAEVARRLIGDDQLMFEHPGSNDVISREISKYRKLFSKPEK